MHHAHTHIPCWKNNTYISPFPNRSLGSWNCSHRSWCTVYITMRMSISEHNYLHMEWKWCVYKTMMMIYIYIYICIPKKIMLGWYCYEYTFGSPLFSNNGKHILKTTHTVRKISPHMKYLVSLKSSMHSYRMYIYIRIYLCIYKMCSVYVYI